ncbi:OsmC family protein [Halalkalicoccus sp. NIPERK01]|uniref:OsmC family protein n=1 Tax=Halalkalicoccus sp. NIPERK01 TaxID=3053469 RepID=UPI00256EF1F2|nr:OsmC family protein [Halalkalicoccus sp. NIPERK01]MDL5360905.1 OsmC family protein [Halalkalicoccus sp. NIPERK01]
MTKEVVSTSEEGFQSTNSVRDFELTIDAEGEETPDTVETLLADYAACYVPALRVGGQQRGVDDLGRIENTVTGEVNDDGKLTSIEFDIAVEADVDDETGQQVVDRANELCKVHDALKESLHADTTIEGDAA